jgi:iron complex transport system substrate-binding protein
VAGEMGSMEQSHIMTSMEALLAIDPDIVFIDAGGLRLVRRAYERKPQIHEALQAFKNRRVHVLHPFNWYLTNIGTALIDAYTVGKILYPDAFHDVVPAEKADEIYTFLVGVPIHEEMEKDYGPIGEPPHFLP